MIRIDLLQRRRGRLRPTLIGLAAVVVVAGAGLGGLYWVDQRYPLYRAWKDLMAVAGGEEARVEADVAMEDRAAGLEEETPAGGELAAEEPAGEGRVAAESPVPEEPPAALPEIKEPVQETAPSQEAQASSPSRYRFQPRWSAACLWAVKLCERLPAGLHLTSLTCSASGEYMLQGTSFSHQIVEEFLETLEQLPSQVTLSWWREGGVRAQPRYRYKFTFQGHFEELHTRDLELLSASQAQTLFGRIPAWARQNGLGGLSLKEPIEMPLIPTRVHQRQKVWATGSYRQISAFLRTLKQVEDIAAVGEVVMVPIYQVDEEWEKARLYAAVDVLVRRP